MVGASGGVFVAMQGEPRKVGTHTAGDLCVDSLSCFLGPQVTIGARHEVSVRETKKKCERVNRESGKWRGLGALGG